jgi:hypothetical protein
MAHDQEHRHHILDECKQFARYYIKEKLKIKVAKGGPSKFFFFLFDFINHDHTTRLH